MNEPITDSLLLKRLPSHIPGLDTLLGGGFFGAGVYIVQGMPGSGKTILANQLCFGHVASGGTAAYVTLLAESHARMLQHIRPLAFFDETAIPDRLRYISAFRELEVDGLPGLVGVLRREMQSRKVSVLVLDGLVMAAESAGTDRELKKFIHELQNNAVFHGCTVFMLTSGASRQTHAEHTMVDGLIELEDRLFGTRPERAIQIRKFRGADALRGKHPMRISDAGIEVFPRLEALFNSAPTARLAGSGAGTGVPTLDAMIACRGWPRESATVVIGSAGTGKTALGLHFLSQSTPNDRGLMFGFFEPPERLLLKADALGLPLRALHASGNVDFIWQSQGEHVLDELGHRLLEAVSRNKATRVVIDSLAGFFEAATSPERIGRFLSCLTNELRRRGATALLVLETRDAVGSIVPTPFGVSGLVDNLVFLRFAEAAGRVHRLVSLLKIRDSDFNPNVHALEFAPTGLRVAGRFSAGGEVIPTAEPVAPPGNGSAAGDTASGA